MKLGRTWFDSRTATDPSNSARKLVGYFKHEQEKIRKHTNTDVAFTWEYSRVSISTGNVKCSRRIRNVQGKGNYRVESVFRVF
jgi:hypothetical protein